jgi:hypothetical protein
MVALMRQLLFSRLAGYEDTNDAERLSVDPAMRHVVGGRATEERAERHKSQRSTPLPEKNRGRIGKRPCKSMEKEENHEKARTPVVGKKSNGKSQ